MPSPLALIGCEARTPLERIADALLVVEEGVVVYAGPRGARPLPPRAEMVDLGGALVCPGFVDLQVNGLGADAVLAADAEAVGRIARELLRRGTTAFLPTATTAAPEALLRAARNVRLAWEAREAAPAAEILGLHLEGPFLSKEMRGAHPAAHLRPVDLGELERIGAAAGGFGRGGRPGLRLVTLSPEVEGAAEAARWLTGRGVVAALGHTATDEAQVEAFLAAGGRFAVHAFNRYGAPGEAGLPLPRPPDHRAPGPMAAVRSDPRLMAGLIADGAHVHPEVVAAFVRSRGWEATTLTSDLVSEGGLSGADAADPAARRAVVHEGVLTGSRLSVGEALPNLRAWCGLETGRALATATRNPARVLGLEGSLGRLAAGARADLCVLDPERLGVRAAMCGGRWAPEGPPIADR